MIKQDRKIITECQAFIVPKKKPHTMSGFSFLACSALASLFVALTGCGDENREETLCGNRRIEPEEDCDSGDLGFATCRSEGFAGGVIACNDSTCKFDTSECCDYCVPGDRCESPAKVGMGPNRYTGIIESNPIYNLPCSYSLDYNAWFEFTAPADGLYEILAWNNERSFSLLNNLIVLDGTSCSPHYGEELLCTESNESPIKSSVTLAQGQTVLIVLYGRPIVDPEITIWKICDSPGEFTCDNGECIPLEEVCDGAENCRDGSDELRCEPGARCEKPQDLEMGSNSFSLTCDDYVANAFTCISGAAFGGWFRFKAPKDGHYEILAKRRDPSWNHYYLVVLDGGGCPSGEEELLCNSPYYGRNSIKGELDLTAGQTVMIVFLADAEYWEIIDPKITIWRSCDPASEFTCDNGRCIPVSGLCDGVVNCGDNSDEVRCEPGDRCRIPTQAHLGENIFTGVFQDDPEEIVTCAHTAANAIWVEFTPPADGDYRILAQNNTATSAYSRLLILDSTGCLPLGEDLSCYVATSTRITGEVTLTAGHPVMIVFATDEEQYTMVDPEITITEMCDPATEFTCKDGGCIPLSELCNNIENCGDGSDEVNCGPGERCMNPEVAAPGVNSFAGVFDDHPEDSFTCASDATNAIWLEFTAPADGYYRISAQNNTITYAHSRLVVLDTTSCTPLGEEMLCETSMSAAITGEVALRGGETVLMVFMTNGPPSTMVDPHITITELCDPVTEFTCADGECIPLSELCDGFENCGDGSDEATCGPGERCPRAAEVYIGENIFSGDFEDDPEGLATCALSAANAIWLEFTAPADGDYFISAENKNSPAWSRLVVLEGSGCLPYGDELHCNKSMLNIINSVVSLAQEQTVLIVFMTDYDHNTMLDPEITITEL